MESRHATKQRDALSCQAKVPAPDASVPQQRRQDGDDGADGNGKAQPLTARDDGGVDANHAAVARNEWTSGVAGIQRRIRLDDVFDQPSRPRPERTSERTDDA